MAARPSPRRQAIEAGEKFYFTGRPCRHGHIAARYVSCGACLPCHQGIEYSAEYHARHYQENKQIYLANSRKWASENRAKSNEIKSLWRDRNPEYATAWAKTAYQKNPEPYRARARERRQKDPIPLNEAMKKWRENNPEKVRAHKVNRRARKVGAGGSGLSGADIKEIVARQKGRCACCGAKTKLQMDHMMPLALGGSNSKNNFQGLCRPCNASKHAKHPIDFNRSKGMLL